ncbi:bifunctional ADP-dependent NAD(P)H-hydrate dehydratase/NAD(P)H-hydrate epimerase [uncultured Pseudokineococcus sp.]|uniref:bifunctional ADP-dependent NAD(P)H-hydrate dehydratase/NAD(P)H-hydrate epimerase n=1 Tax=uncultured Pseudokineococcus sp. TaxID=1642928 RepID=UPI00260EFB33|nr:bifunctional ADP-dependent NAD(P)H-hydrate dehydratase/NAD(P)H-hydrate epimerase [uncultured Pseudokineococcus sp.]
MTSAHDVEAVRAAEQAAAAGLPGGLATLVERASAALAGVVGSELRAVAGRVYGSRAVLLVGSGTNGGDALHAGALLARRGASVTALLAADRSHEPRAHGPGLAALRAAGGRVVEDGAGEVGLAAVAAADIVVDGLLGVGGRPGLRGAAAALAGAAERSSARVVAVDVPSGVDVTTGALPSAPTSASASGSASGAASGSGAASEAATGGEGSGTAAAVRADVTVTFGTAKPALLLPPASALAGRVVVAPIGLGDLGDPVVERLGVREIADLWPRPDGESDKYSRGVLGVVAGGATFPGAAVLSTGAAVRAGAGMVRYLGPTPPTDLVRSRWPEVVPGPGRVQAWLLGPGVDPDDEGQGEHVREALAQDVPCVVDAGALPALVTALDEGERGSGGTLVVPHAGELARLLGLLGHDCTRADVQERPLEHARRAADASGVVVLLKGSTTLVVDPEGEGGGPRPPVRAQADGTPWLATAGSGDVLAGVVGALAALGLAPRDAGAVGAAVHGLAAHAASGGGPLHAEAVLHALPEVLTALLVDVPRG